MTQNIRTWTKNASLRDTYNQIEAIDKVPYRIIKFEAAVRSAINVSGKLNEIPN